MCLDVNELDTVSAGEPRKRGNLVDDICFDFLGTRLHRPPAKTA